MFFAKYDVDGDGEFSMEEGANLIEDLDNDRIDNVVYITTMHFYGDENINFLHLGRETQDWAETSNWNGKANDCTKHKS